MFPDKDFQMNVRLRMYKYSYSNLGAIYAKGLHSQEHKLVFEKMQFLRE